MLKLAWASLAAVLVAVVAPRPAVANVPPDTAAVLNDLSRPVVAVDPASGGPHLAYVSGGELRHTWKSGGVWQTETIADTVSVSTSFNTYGGFDLGMTSDGRAVVAYVRRGALVCAVREGAGWTRDTLDTMPGPYFPVSLAVSPATGEPAVAWVRAATTPGDPARVRYARRSAGLWSAQQLDTTSSRTLVVSLGMDAGGRPRVAWARPRADDAGGMVLTCALGEGPDGPFTAAAVDSQLIVFISLAVDPMDGEPRIAYDAGTTCCPRSIRYAWRDAGGAWHWTLVTSSGSSPTTPPALALDPAGNPFVTITKYDPIGPGRPDPVAPDETSACGVFQTGEVDLLYRLGGAGDAAFGFLEVFARPWQQDILGGARAVASGSPGVADVVWKSPSAGPSLCGPFALSYARTQIPLAVGDRSPSPSALEAVLPNPARAGDAMRVAFALRGAAGVTLELHDLAGRRVAAQGPVRAGAGRGALDWSLPTLRPGLYWLTLRADGVRVGTRPVAILP